MKLAIFAQHDSYVSCRVRFAVVVCSRQWLQVVISYKKLSSAVVVSFISFSVWERSQKCGKQLLASSCPSVCQSVLLSFSQNRKVFFENLSKKFKVY